MILSCFVQKCQTTKRLGARWLAGPKERKLYHFFFFKCRREMVEKMLNPANVTEKLRIQNVCDARLK